MDNLRTTKSFTIGLTLILLVSVAIFLTSALWSAGYTITSWVLPVCIVTSLSIEFYLSRSIKLVFGTFAFIIVSLLLSGLLFDYTYDSNAYHKVTVLYLSNGWNPLHYADNPDTNLWTLHYAKLLEIFSAVVFSATGVLEQGKCINIILAAAMAAICYDYLKSLQLKRYQLWIVMLVTLCNPVLSTQLLTFYIDYTTYTYAVMSIILIGNILRKRWVRISYGLLFLVTLLSIGTKFNVFFYQGILLMSAIVWGILTKRYPLAKYLVILGLSSLVIGALVFWHPYITNTLGWGNPLFPLLGDNAVDIMTYNTPMIYDGHGRIVNFMLSLITPCERLGIFTNYDSRSAGFTLVSLPLLIFCSYLMIRGIGKWPRVAYYVMAVTLISCFVFEQLWWARYIPQLWLIPVVCTLCYFRYDQPVRFVTVVLAMFLGAVIMLSFVPQTFELMRKTWQMELLRKDLSDKRIQIENPSEADTYLLEQWHIDYESVDTLTVEKLDYFGGRSPFGY